MQASGVGYWQLAKPTVALSFFFTIFLYFLTIYFLPFSFRKHRDILMTLKQESLASLVSVGQFNTFENYTVYARDKDAQGNFLGILIFDASQKDKSTTLMAEKGILFNETEGSHLLLINGNRQENDITTGKPAILYFDRYIVETKDKSFGNMQKSRSLKTHEQSVSGFIEPKRFSSFFLTRLSFSLPHINACFLPFMPWPLGWWEYAR